MKTIRILHILQSHSFSGAENVVCQIVGMFRNKPEYEMVYSSPKGEIRKVLEEKSILYYPLTKLSVREIKRVIRIVNPDVIHTHDIQASVLATIAAGSIPIVVHVHGNHLNMRKVTVKSVCVAILSKKWSKIIWVSKSALNDYVFSRFIKKKSIILMNTIQKDSIIKRLAESGSSRSFDCVVLGRVNRIKNPLRALGVFKKVADELPSLKVAFIGNGDLMSNCIDYIRNNDLSNNIEMLGFIDNPIPILSNSKILVMTSVYEGIPMSALEAMALGLPIVSTPTDGLVDLVEQNVTGFCSANDDELCKAIVMLLTDGEAYKRMHDNTLERFNHLMNIEKYVSTLDHIYKEARK